jgi:uncharacterized protein YndB with AHSA1/START domain
MTVTNVTSDASALAVRFTSEYDAPAERVWQMWADPRRLERWWGPPTYPATFVDHDLRPQGRMSYYMTGPGGDRHHGWWRVTAVEAPRRIEFDNGMADENGEPVAHPPAMRVVVTLSERAGGGTRMEISAIFPSIEAMDTFLSMGFKEGLTGAMGQIDAILA